MVLIPALLLPGIFRRYRSYSTQILLLAFVVLILEPLHHVRTSYSFIRPEKRLDLPFHDACANPSLEAAQTRENAVIFMLARNSEVDDAIQSISSLESQFNQWFQYPWVFLNDEQWSAEFKDRVRAAIDPSVSVTFDTIDESMWSWPSHFLESDKQRARRTWQRMHDAMDEEFQNGTHVTKDSYHHMCRFNSGFFYDHPALKKYKWYWRVEPGVSFTCTVPYDPFRYMAKQNKIYGYTIALYEVGSLIPSFFRDVSDFADARYGSKKPALWNAMHEPSWAPWPIRRYLLSHLGSRNAHGDAWNLCHFWSNFEIADLDFFRSQEYRDLFQYLDQRGGFYYERWGDAPVHSLAAALMLQPEQVHYFQDIGYGHQPFQHCPIDEGVGCRCNCDKQGHVIQYCLQRLRETVEPQETDARLVHGL